MATTVKPRRKLTLTQGSLEMRTEIGKKWAERLRVSEAYYKANSRDWEALRKLYDSVYAMRNRWGASISMAYSVVQNVINATYLQNPEPWIESLQSDGREDADKMLRGLFKTIDRDTGLATIMEHGQVMTAIEGYALAWQWFEQTDHLEHYGEAGVPVTDDEIAVEGLVKDKESPSGYSTVVADRERVCRELVYGHDVLHDPDGRRWDLADHKWIARIYTRSLQYFTDIYDRLGADSGFTPDGIQMLRQWVAGQRNQRRPDRPQHTWNDKEGYVEDDPAYINVSCWEIWSKAEYKKIHVPVGAEFHIGVSDWEDEWKDANRYPCDMIALNWRPPDEEGKIGFYPTPSLRLIRTHLENLNRLEPLFMDAATFDVKKYIAISGLLDEPTKARLQDDKNRDWLEIDVSTLKKIFPGLQTSPDALDIRKLFMLLPTEARSEKADRYLQAIAHEIEMIREITGQGSLNRGGSAAETATATLTREQHLSARTSRISEQLADIVDRIHETTWVLLHRKAQLPIPYELAVEGDRSKWELVFPDEIRDMHLIFRHHAGSARPPSKEVVKLERKEVAQIALPVLQAMQMTRETKVLMKWWLSAYDDLPRDVAGLFDDQIPQLAQQVALTIAIAKQYAEAGIPLDMRASSKLIETASALANSVMSAADVGAVAQQLVALTGSPASPESPTATGSLPSGKSAGQRAFQAAAGAAGAGAIGATQ